MSCRVGWLLRRRERLREDPIFREKERLRKRKANGKGDEEIAKAT